MALAVSSTPEFARVKMREIAFDVVADDLRNGRTVFGKVNGGLEEFFPF